MHDAVQVAGAYLNVGISVLQSTVKLGGQANESCIGLCISIC